MQELQELKPWPSPQLLIRSPFFSKKKKQFLLKQAQKKKRVEGRNGLRLLMESIVCVCCRCILIDCCKRLRFSSFLSLPAR